jgi:hypothetical protein
MAALTCFIRPTRDAHMKMALKLPDFKQISKKYLIFGTILFVAYEVCFSFAIAYSQINVTPSSGPMAALTCFIRPTRDAHMKMALKPINASI